MLETFFHRRFFGAADTNRIVWFAGQIERLWQRAEVAMDNDEPIDPEDQRLIAALIRAHMELERLRELH